jgi:hypothetical protein
VLRLLALFPLQLSCHGHSRSIFTIRCELPPTRIIGLWLKVIGAYLLVKRRVMVAHIYCS